MNLNDIKNIFSLFIKTTVPIVGIGTTTPAVELDVHTGTINAASICDENNANCLDLSAGIAGDNLGNHTMSQTLNMNGNWINGDTDAGEGFQVTTAGLGWLTFTSGATTPRGHFIENESTAVGSGAGIWMASGASTNNGARIGTNYQGGNSSDLTFEVGSANTLVERMRIDSDGNVGIGTTVPLTALDVDGDTRVRQSLQIADSDNSNHVGFAAPAIVGSDLIWTLPASDGTSGQVLSTNGSGVLSWVSSGGSGDFTANGNVPMTGPFQAFAGTEANPGITFDGDEDTGIFRQGTNTLGFTFGGNERIRLDDDSLQSSAGTSYHLYNFAGDATNPTYSFTGDTDTGLFRPLGDTIAFTNGAVETMRLSSTGNLGIGTTTPSASLHVIDSGNNVAKLRSTSNSGYNTIEFQDDAGATAGWFGYGNDAVGVIWARDHMYLESTNANIAIAANNTHLVEITQSGSVGIGTTTPSTKLDVEGTILSGPSGVAAGNGGAIRFEELATNGVNTVGFRAPDSIAANVLWQLPAADGTSGQVLSTDGSGVLSWTTPSAGVAADSLNFTDFADNLVLDASTDISATGSDVFSITKTGTGDAFIVNTTLSPFRIANNGVIHGAAANFASVSMENLSAYSLSTNNGWSGSGYVVVDVGVGNSNPIMNWIKNSSTRMILDENGSLGIGTNDPAEKLDVEGTILSGPKGTAAGEGGAIKFEELATNGVNTVGFRAPDSIAANVLWQLPATDGTSGQVLQTNGSGVLSWVSSGSSAALNDLTDAVYDATAESLYVGALSGNGATSSNTRNTALGHGALDAINNATAIRNTAIGWNSLTGLTTGANNTAVGSESLDSVSTGSSNVGIGREAMGRVTTGSHNTAVGTTTLFEINVESDNTAVGSFAGVFLNGSDNVAIGRGALEGSGTGPANDNVGVGKSTLSTISDGDSNTAIGDSSLWSLTTGSQNTALGKNTGQAITTGSGNILIGYGVNASGAAASNELNIGNTIYGNLSSGNVGIGTATPANKLVVDDSYWDSTGIEITGYFSAWGGGPNAVSSDIRALQAFSQTAGEGAGNEATAIAGYGRATNDAFSQNSLGVYAIAETHNLDFGFGVRIDDPVGSTGGTMYGLFIDLDNAAVNRYGIYQVTDNDNYFAGSVGIGTSSPGANTKLDVNGQIRSTASSTTSGAINFVGGNTVTTSYDCSGNLSLANIRPGGSYSIVVTSTNTTRCDFSTTTTGDDAATVTYRFQPANAVRVASSHTVYTLLRVGDIIYISWITGFQ